MGGKVLKGQENKKSSIEDRKKVESQDDSTGLGQVGR
jgi:hypothetical protein